MWCGSSDVPFLTVTLASSLLFARSEGRIRLLLLGGILAAIAVSLRYAGVFLGFAFGVSLLLQHRLQIRLLLRDGACLIGPPLAMAITLFARNQAVVGTWRGGNNYSPETPVVEVLKLVYYVISHLCGFSMTSLKELQPAAVVLALLGVVTAISALVVIGKKAGRELFGRRLLSPPSIGFIYGPISIALLFYLHATKSSGMSPRLFLPAVPFAAVSLGWLYQTASQLSPWPRRMHSALLVFGLASFAVGQSQNLDHLQMRAEKGNALNAALLQPASLTSDMTLRAFLQKEVTVDQPMMSSMPQLTYLLTDCPQIGLPVSVYNSENRPWSADRVRKRVLQYNVRYVLLLKRTGTVNSVLPEFFEELLAGQQPEWLTYVGSCEDFELFEVRARASNGL